LEKKIESKEEEEEEEEKLNGENNKNEEDEEEKEDEKTNDTKKTYDVKKKYYGKNCVFVRIPFSVQNNELIEAFKSCGEVVDMNNKSSEKNFAFVYFKNFKSVDNAVKNNILINGTKLIVEKRRFKPFIKRGNFKKIN
jgi:RNA recognition motif-containing protein